MEGLFCCVDGALWCLLTSFLCTQGVGALLKEFFFSFFFVQKVGCLLCANTCLCRPCIMHLLVTWPLAVLAFCLGLFRKSQKGRGVGRRGSIFSSDYYLSPWSSGCVLAPSGCWKPSPESSSFLEAFKGNTFSVYFCPFFFPSRFFPVCSSCNKLAADLCTSDS